jgi:uncharacterized membrane protein YdbT with pleckstrin-like domain
MASYVESSLIPGEKVEFEANVTFLSQLLWFVLALLTLTTVIGPILFVLVAVLNVKTTELAVTNKKVVGKAGWISRRSVDLPLQKVESITISESILGRVFGYGSVSIAGTGGHQVAIPYIKGPVSFKQAVMTLVDKLQNTPR